MKQYLDLLKFIDETGVQKGEARDNMPTTKSIFGYQYRHKLSNGFPALTTKKIPVKGLKAELLWFLKGYTHIKHLDEYNVDYMWHDDAFSFYQKIASKNLPETCNNIFVPTSIKNNLRNVPIGEHDSFSLFTNEEFREIISSNTLEELQSKYKIEYKDDKTGTFKYYTLGDCGHQYGKLWRDWKSYEVSYSKFVDDEPVTIDQIDELIKSIKNNPYGRRHIVTSWDPIHLNDMALNTCHTLFQFNCRPYPIELRLNALPDKYDQLVVDYCENPSDELLKDMLLTRLKEYNVPEYYLDCQFYQRSADTVLGVPLNLASYSLLTHIIAELLNMIPGDIIHTFGDAHIYSDHKEAVEENLSRTPTELPKLLFKDEFHYSAEMYRNGEITAVQFIDRLQIDFCKLEGYNPQPAIKAPLSTGYKEGIIFKQFNL